ncbi:hypothetical protein CM318V1_310065 [Carnobacterium maltaromaticum]|nr:hypothetical protein CM318V1_310065 [Carnobacterium maltaromaticum]
MTMQNRMQNVLHSLHFDTFFNKMKKPSKALYIKVLDGFSIYLHSCRYVS